MKNIKLIGVFAFIFMIFSVFAFSLKGANAEEGLNPAVVPQEEEEEDNSPNPAEGPCFENNAPVIHMFGSSELEIPQGFPYEDPGAEAKDKEDGQIEVEIHGEEVDPNTPGHYLVKYGAKDSCGESSEVLTRKVIVVRVDDEEEQDLENTAPVIKLNGSKIIKMFVGQTFIDPWFKAVDKEDGSLDDGILEYVYDNDGITETPERGIYRLRYGVRDSGNPTDEVLTAKAKRLVVVKNTQEIDSDEDGIPDDLDNCPSVPNEDQLDENENDIGDACENQEPTDSDEDGIEDSSDNCPSVPNEDQADADNDGIGDACDDTPNGDNNNNEEGTITTGGSSGSSGSGSSSSSNGGEVLGAFLDASSGEVLGASSSCVEYLKSYMRFGRVNSKEEVLKLQAFLNIFEGAGLKLDGVFGPNTDAAVRNLQQKYGEDILSPWGIDQSTGYVYITTKWFINNKYCPGLARPNVN